MIEVDLVLGRAARQHATERIWELTPRRWGRAYDGDARAQLEFAISRVAGVTSSRRLDCQVDFDMFPLPSVVVLNPERAVLEGPGYPTLAELLRRDPSVQSIPVVLAVSDLSVPTLWDGHRRWATYLSAGRDSIPAWTCNFSSGTGRLRIVAGT